MMKKISIFAAILGAILFTSCSSNQTTPKVGKLTTNSDSISYVYGTYMGEAAKKAFTPFPEDLNMSIYSAAFAEALKGEKSQLTEEQIKEVIEYYFTTVKPNKTKEAEKALVEDVKKNNPKAVVSESGLIYEIIEPGDTSAKPILGDTISVLYTGTYTNGEVFDATSNRNNEPLNIVLGQTIAGWNEGMQLLGKGGKVKLWIPANLGYGEQMMIFETELVDVIPPKSK